MNKYLITNHITKEKIIVEANSAQEAAQQVGCRIKEVSPMDIGQPKLSGMKVSEAIEILKDTRNITFNYFSPDRKDALQLGIEALKRHRDRDYTDYNGMHERLPGESPEEEV